MLGLPPMNEPVTGAAAHEIREQLRRIQSGELNEHDMELKREQMSANDDEKEAFLHTSKLSASKMFEKHL